MKLSPWQAVGPVGAAALSTQSAGPLSGQRKVILASLISICARVDVLPSWQVLNSPILGCLFNQNQCQVFPLEFMKTFTRTSRATVHKASWLDHSQMSRIVMENLKDFEICQVEFTIYPYMYMSFFCYIMKYGWLEPRFTGHLIYLAQSKSMKSHHAGDSCSWKELRRAKSGRGGTLGVKHGWAWAQTNLKEEGVIANRGNFGTQWLCIPSIS